MGAPQYSFDELTNDFGHVAAVLADESPMACALIGAAYVERLLNALLRDSFLDNKPWLKEAFGTGSFLENSGAQNDLARLLGLISPQIHDAIVLINKIRNTFAHSHRPVTFDTDKVSSRCIELGRIFKMPHSHTGLTRTTFVMGVSYTSTYLTGKAKIVQRVVVYPIIEDGFITALNKSMNSHPEPDGGQVEGAQ